MPDDRARLERELHQLEAEVAQAQAQAGRGKTSEQSAPRKRVVQLELERDSLQRAVAEQGERVSHLAEVVFSVTLDTHQKLAEQGGRLSVLEPAFRAVSADRVAAYPTPPGVRDGERGRDGSGDRG
jgi:uncharacterized protein YlxW (UPF0749 family)